MLEVAGDDKYASPLFVFELYSNLFEVSEFGWFSVSAGMTIEDG
jgi:hypothetical protein